MKTTPARAPKPAATRPQGRPALAEGEASVFVGIRMTADQRSKLQRLGGAAWIRKRIDKAGEP